MGGVCVCVCICLVPYTLFCVVHFLFNTKIDQGHMWYAYAL